MSIVVLDGYTINQGDLSWDVLKEFGGVTVYDRTEDAQILPRIGDAEIVLTNKTKLGKKVFDAKPRIKYVGEMATGYDNVDIAAARKRGITVCNIPDYGTDGVAEMVFALLLELCRNVGSYSAAVKNGEWAASKYFCFFKEPIIELGGKTIGIIGYGKIGRRVAAIAQAFGMKVLAYSRRKESVEEADTLKYATLDDLLEHADVISLHCPMTEQTRHIIDREAIAAMKDGAMLINTSRGGLVDEPALRDALNSGKLAGAGCDVVSVEPIKPDNALLGAKNIILTPHVAWASRQSRQRLITITADNIRAFLSGCPVNVVN